MIIICTSFPGKRESSLLSIDSRFLGTVLFIIYHLSFIIVLLSPEVLAEQIMGYAVGAMEMIPTLKTAAQKTYDIAIIPQGPHFYTGLLQSAGYLLLNKKKKKLLIISQQTDAPSHILIDTTTYEPIFGKKRIHDGPGISDLKANVSAIGSTKKHPQFSKNLSIQMPFFSVLMEAEELIHLGVGEKISPIQLKKCISWLLKNSDQYVMVFLANIELPGGSKATKKTNEEKLITQSIQKGPSTVMMQIFQTLLTKQKKKVEMIAYVKPQKAEKSSDAKIRYVCAVG